MNNKFNDRWPLLGQVDMVEAIDSYLSIGREQIEAALDEGQRKAEQARADDIAGLTEIDGVQLELGGLYDVIVSPGYGTKTSQKRGMRYVGNMIAAKGYHGDTQVLPVWMHHGLNPKDYWAKREWVMPISITRVQPNAKQASAIEAWNERYVISPDMALKSEVGK